MYGFFLTRFKDNIGILRCFHMDKDRALSLLKSIQYINETPVCLETIATSGTIKSLIRKHLDGNQLHDS